MTNLNTSVVVINVDCANHLLSLEIADPGTEITFVRKKN
jgi:hypothetical protein